MLIPLLLAVILFTAGCEQKPAATKAPPVLAPWPGDMAITTTPSPPVVNKDTAFRVHLTDGAGNPVTGASVKASLIMTTMDMGKNEVALAGKGSGDYAGTGKFTMAGPWRVEVTANAGGTSGQQSFPIVVHRE